MNLIKPLDLGSVLTLIHDGNMSLLLMLGCLGLFTGCATGDKERILPQDGPTMKQVYDNHFSGGRSLTGSDDSDPTASSQRRPSPRAEADLSGYTRDAYAEIQQIFPRLHNPTLVLYVFPHLSASEQNPVPGYSTAFTLYEQTEFALPGETEAGY